MPIPQNQILSAEINVQGLIAAAGSNSIQTNFIFHYRRTTVAVAPNKANLKTAFLAAILGTTIGPALNNTWTAQFIRIRFPNDAQDMYTDFSDSTTGSITGDRMASEDSAYMRYRTNLRGKSYRGSKHFGPMSESDSTSGSEDLFNAACLTRLAAINTALLTPLTDSDGNIWNFAILSRKLSQLKTNPTTVVINDVTAAAVNKRVGSMLGRKVLSVY